MSSRYDDESQELVVRPRRRGGLLPWTLLFLVVSAIGVLAYFGVPEWLSLREARARATPELRRLRLLAADAERRARDAAEEVTRDRQCEAQLAEVRSRLEGTERRAADRDDLAQRLATLMPSQGGEISTENGRITLRLVDTLLFRVGAAELTPAGIRVLQQVAPALRASDRQIWIQGHTDDSPIHDTELFRSNWELSSARALSVVHYLQEQAAVPPDRLAAVGFGEHRPAAAQKARNRRIEIVLLPLDVRVVSDTPAPEPEGQRLVATQSPRR